MVDRALIKVLGTAQDAGHPQLNCQCSHCQAARTDASLKRLQSSLALIDKKEQKSFVFDASPAFSEQLDNLNELVRKKNYSVDHLSGILLSHAHLGHYLGLLYLGKEALNTSQLPVYLSQKMFDFLKNNAPWSDLFKNGNIKAEVFEFEKEYNLTKEIRFKAVEIKHRNEYADTAAFIVNTQEKAFFYLPDLDSWQGFERKFREILAEVDYVFLDGTFFDKKELGELRGRDLKEVPHPPIIETIKLFSDLNKAERSKIYFTHFNHTNRILDLDANKFEYVKSKHFNLLEEGQEFNL
ncbi:coenzyme PQQ synthesis protein B [Halanaerobium hydrogeniformans]|uniref:Coenzyme PQQ synthesis protein B n=1 Tax=Halanaerobium hydrogeniformans TaxID=656519 RepID=E4RPQ8_HALHG|nr:MBL fold metallo-hydrolase [Halanaerobium hydrogeniformans]ADQ13942.1 coenzyme PQQ synthesis protein B [Halanaerobium hydrogeniformans]